MPEPRDAQVEEPPRVEEEFYILASGARAEERARVLKHGETFAVFDPYGDIVPTGLGEQGLYHDGTRFLSRYVLFFGNDRPLFLDSTVEQQNMLLSVDLTNPDVYAQGCVQVPRGTLHFLRSKFLWQGTCYERLTVWNYGLFAVPCAFTVRVDADFADVFEVRGITRPRRGERLANEVSGREIVLAYLGLDGRLRRTRLACEPQPTSLSARALHVEAVLPPHGTASYVLTVACDAGLDPARRLSYDEALAEASAALDQARQQTAELTSSNEQFNEWVGRAVTDLRMMATETPQGPYPYAGVPWFSAPFGRDGLITALEYLWFHPAMARGVLGYLAATQAEAHLPEQDAEPGKILHETRRGEMAQLGEIPFKRYYGSVDATPLFLMLAGAYYERTGELAFIRSIWPNLERALRWIDEEGDLDGDGFVEYQRRSSHGLVHQGWKDSKDAIFHADGALAEGPIALCEVQGYVYAAKRSAAELASALGHLEQAGDLWRQARGLQQQFEQAFWCEELSTYALALDGQKRPCRVRASNAGHCLLTGIVSPARAHRVAGVLLGDSMFSGWGVRTVAETEPRYNPMSYHNGSVWPHDNALIAEGLAQYGFKELALRVLNGLFGAALFLDLRRLPELICGFTRRAGQGPTLYPVACAPQAWAAAAAFFLLKACLGITIKGAESQLRFTHPRLPPMVQKLWINGLRIGEGSVDLLLQRQDEDVGVTVLSKRGRVEVVAVR